MFYIKFSSTSSERIDPNANGLLNSMFVIQRIIKKVTPEHPPGPANPPKPSESHKHSPKPEPTMTGYRMKRRIHWFLDYVFTLLLHPTRTKKTTRRYKRYRRRRNRKWRRHDRRRKRRAEETKAKEAVGVTEASEPGAVVAEASKPLPAAVESE